MCGLEDFHVGHYGKNTVGHRISDESSHADETCCLTKVSKLQEQSLSLRCLFKIKKNQ